MKKWLMMITAAATMSLVAACGDDNAEEAQEETAQEGHAGGEAEEMPEPDLEDVPDVVAEVEGEEITKDEFEQVYTQEFQQRVMMQQMTGEEIDEGALKEQVVERLVSNELLLQEAESRDMEASEEEIDEIIDQLIEINGMESEDEYISAVEESGMSEEELRAQIADQVKMQQLISEESGDTEPTEEEMQEVYDEQIAAREDAGEDSEAPEFEEVKPQIEEQLTMEKEAEAAQNLSDELREEADVTIHI
ncbi:SurA N-terminal domain-containing protein [Salinicoccus halitifaciens]|uniref:peptidylprolyl isomerase n=1 Tax=Salinicoccus halitifaciens TaxID=1073415 RepID=A0ABV2EBN8_9STAP|nr:SurA N-terminal domain-containing protein [Salinicoccus halitifaciens]MCD2138843.1 SurA N-terminal domain-containing protein [Salinicoccus halitifaciens]